MLVSSEDVSAGKPAPDCYLIGAARLGVPIAACAVFEDSANGIAAARAAGAGLVVGVGPDAAEYDVDASVTDLRAVGWREGRLVVDRLAIDR